MSRKSHHAPSVLALCKKFQPDYEKPATLAHAHLEPCDWGPPAPDRAVLC